MTSALRVLFRCAAGPRAGFGHMVRAGVLADAMGVVRLGSIRGGSTACAAARGAGWRVIEGPASQTLAAAKPDVLVIDDPSAAAARVWRETARRLGIPVASVHDLGRARCDADLAIDGSITMNDGRARAGRLLAGPRYAILNIPADSLSAASKRREGVVLIALGGGPRAGVALRIARAMRTARPGCTVRIAAGMVPAGMTREPGITWVGPQPNLVAELRTCQAAIVAGGVTLYEAVALGTPVVAWPVVAAQTETVRAFARRGLAIPVLPGPSRARRAAASVARVLASRPGARALSGGTGQPIVDAGGASRVAAAITRLALAKQGRAA